MTDLIRVKRIKCPTLSRWRGQDDRAWQGEGDKMIDLVRVKR